MLRPPSGRSILPSQEHLHNRKAAGATQGRRAHGAAQLLIRPILPTGQAPCHSEGPTTRLGPEPGRPRTTATARAAICVRNSINGNQINTISCDVNRNSFDGNRKIERTAPWRVFRTPNGLEIGLAVPPAAFSIQALDVQPASPQVQRGGRTPAVIVQTQQRLHRGAGRSAQPAAYLTAQNAAHSDRKRPLRKRKGDQTGTKATS